MIFHAIAVQVLFLSTIHHFIKTGADNTASAEKKASDYLVAQSSGIANS